MSNDSTTTTPLTQAERTRYARHLILPELGEAGQLRLKAARVLVVGAGGLGSPLLLYLAAAGVGTIGIVDPDTVSLSNLQRQVLYSEQSVGLPKVEAARQRLTDMNPHLHIRTYPVALTTANALDIIADYDLVADGSDNFPTRYLVNDACVLAGKPCVYGAIFRFEGQVSVFNLLLPDGTRSSNYRDLYPTPPAPGQVPNCAEAGVLGVLPGIIGTLQANEVIKVITGIGQPLAGRVWLFDAATMQPFAMAYAARTGYRIDALVDYEAFCGMPSVGAPVPLVSYTTLLAWQQAQHPLLLIDVRQPEEHAAHNLGGKLLPLAELHHRLTEFPIDTTIVLYCQTGNRSAQAAQLLLAHGRGDVFSLEGGVLAATLR